MATKPCGIVTVEKGIIMCNSKIEKPIVKVEDVEIPSVMRKTLSGLSYEEQVKYFTLIKNYDHSEKCTLSGTEKLSILEHEDVESIIVSDEIIVGVTVSLHDIYFSYTSYSSTEYFNRASGKIHQLSSRYGGDYYKIYSNAKYTLTCTLL